MPAPEVIRAIVPTREQELLLRAVFLNSHADWEHWKRIMDPANPDQATKRLLPLLHPKIDTFEMHDSLRNVIRELYVETWMKNQMRLKDLSEVLRYFQEASLPTLVLKGAALIGGYYKDPGIRPMVDLDILVPLRDAVRAIDLLEAKGYSPQKEARIHFSRRLVPYLHAYAFSNDTLSKIDLHWHVLPECLGETEDDDFWKDSVELNFPQPPSAAYSIMASEAFPAPSRSRMLCAEDQLLHVCVHGSWRTTPPSVRWTADALIVLQTHKDWNWDRFIGKAQSKGVLVPVRHALNYLTHAFHAPVPEQVLHELRQLAVPRHQVEEFRFKSERRGANLLGNLPLLWYTYLRRSRVRTRIGTYWGFLTYLKEFWGLPSRTLLPFALLKRMLLRASNVS